MSLIEEREPFASKLARLTAKVERELAEVLSPKGKLDREWGRAERKPHTKRGVAKPRAKRVPGENPNWERW